VAVIPQILHCEFVTLDCVEPLVTVAPEQTTLFVELKLPRG